MVGDTFIEWYFPGDVILLSIVRPADGKIQVENL